MDSILIALSECLSQIQRDIGRTEVFTCNAIIPLLSYLVNVFSHQVNLQLPVNQLRQFQKLLPVGRVR